MKRVTVEERKTEYVLNIYIGGSSLSMVNNHFSYYVGQRKSVKTVAGIDTA